MQVPSEPRAIALGPVGGLPVSRTTRRDRPADWAGWSRCFVVKTAAHAKSIHETSVGRSMCAQKQYFCTKLMVKLCDSFDEFTHPHHVRGINIVYPHT